MDYDLPADVSNPDNVAEDIHFADAILNMFNDSDKFDYIVEDDDAMASEETGSTNYPAVWNPITMRHEITSRFNPDYFEKATDLSMARTMIHESVHAYLIYTLRTKPFGNLKEALETYAEEHGFPNDFDNRLNHNFMAQFVNAMAFILRRWDRNHGTGGNLGWQYYHDMAWGGLGKYELDENNNPLFYQEYLDHTTAEERERIDDIIENEAENYSNSSQSGAENDCQ